MTDSNKSRIRHSSHCGIVGRILGWSGTQSACERGYVFLILPATNDELVSQAWLPPEVSGIGAGIDSFYEYALKWYVLSGECSPMIEGSTS